MLFPYEYTDRYLTALVRFLDEGRAGLWLVEAPAKVSDFFATNPAVTAGVTWAQVAAGVLSAAFTFVIVVALMKTHALKQAAAATSGEGDQTSPAFSPAPNLVGQRWTEIRGHLDSPREAEWKIAVIEADKLLDDTLARAGFSGDTFGDRLMNIEPGALRSLDGLWWAHKVRNRLAHETDYFLRYTEARQAMSYYEQALQELQLLS